MRFDNTCHSVMNIDPQYGWLFLMKDVSNFQNLIALALQCSYSTHVRFFKLRRDGKGLRQGAKQHGA